MSSYAAIPAVEGNSRRILNLTRALRELGHDVHFILLPSGLSPSPDIEGHVREFGDDRFVRLEPDPIYKLLYFPRRALGELKRKIRNLLNSEKQYYFGLDEFFGEKWRRRLQSIHKDIGFDAVVVEYIFQSAALDDFPGNVVKIIDTHDDFADRHLAFKLSNYLYSIPVSEQVRGLRRADTVIAIQDEEAALFRRQLGSPPPEVAVVSHLLDLDRRITDYSPASAVFLGSGNLPNVVSARFFIEKVLPLIRRELPEFILHLAGSVCSKIADSEGVVKLGIVEHISDAFSRASISLNPMLQGTGINIKLLDAMAAGVVTVATRTGARGLPEAYRSGVIIVEDGDEQALADAVIAMARDRSLREARGEAAYRDAAAWNEVQKAALAAVLSVSPTLYPPDASNRSGADRSGHTDKAR